MPDGVEEKVATMESCPGISLQGSPPNRPNHADAARAVNVARHDADLALRRRGDDAGAVRPEQAGALALEVALGLHHVVHRDALGDGDAQRHLRLRRLHDRVRRERAAARTRTTRCRRWPSPPAPRCRRWAPCSRTSGRPCRGRRRPPRCRAVLQHLLRVERAGRAGDA